MIRIVCRCGKRLIVEDGAAGGCVMCLNCRGPVPVPDPSAAAPDPPGKRPRPAGGLVAGLSRVFRGAPDARTAGEKQWDELATLLRGIRYRLTWVVILLILLAFHLAYVADRVIRHVRGE